MWRSENHENDIFLFFKIPLSSVFRRFHQEYISKRESVSPSIYPFIYPSISSSVCLLGFLKNRSFLLFSAAAMLQIKSIKLWYAQRLFYLFVRPSICPSLYLTCLLPKSIHARTQFRRIVARLGLLFHVLAMKFPQISQKNPAKSTKIL